jgi:hypothetical protein
LTSDGAIFVIFPTPRFARERGSPDVVFFPCSTKILEGAVRCDVSKESLGVVGRIALFIPYLIKETDIEEVASKWSDIDTYREYCGG